MLWGTNRGKWKSRQSPGVEPRTPLAWAASALPLSHDSQTTTNPHNPLCILHRWYWMPQLHHIWQPPSMCHLNSVRGRPENSLHQERTHAEWFFSLQMLKASCLKLEIRCYEAKIEESEKSEKAGSRRESNPGHLWLEPPVLCHWSTTASRPPTLTILYVYWADGTECLSCTSGSDPACAVRTPLGVDRKILSIRKEPMLSGVSHFKCWKHLASRWK